MRKRVNIKRILANPVLRRKLMIRSIQAIQNREGIDTTRKQAADAYDSVNIDILIYESEDDIELDDATRTQYVKDRIADDLS